jgi:hypothetical protein
LEKIEAVLARLKIERVVWVDDIFEQPGVMSDEELAHYLQNETTPVFVCQEAGFTSRFIDLVRELAGGPDNSGLYRQSLGSESEEAKVALSGIARKASAEKRNELTGIQVTALKRVFGDKLVPCSFTDWPSRAAALMKDERAVFLVDLKNETNVNGLNGKSILEQLIANKFAGLVTLFTHECERSGEIELLEKIRVELQTSESNDVSSSLRIGVVSKQRCQQEDIEKVKEDLAEPLHRLAMTSTFFHLANRVAKSLIQGIQEGVIILSKLPITDIDRAVFQNSMREGCSEIEFIERLLSLTQRDAVAKSLKVSNDLNELLAKARDSWISTNISAPPKGLSDSLVLLRTLEIFDSDALINKTHSPLSNGDIFEHRDGDKIRQYVLLMSPCDSMVRDDGTRQLDTGVLVSLTEIENQKKGIQRPSVVTEPPNGANVASTVGRNEAASPMVPAIEENMDEHDARLRYYNIPANLEKTYRLDFMVSSPVVLDTLEWCVFNEDGKVQYNRQVTPKFELLKGWSKRLRKLKEHTGINRCGEPSNIPWPYRYAALKTRGFSSIHSTSIEKDGEGKNKKGHFFFELQRVKRLRSPYADAALSAFLNYSGRPAFEHEFLR